MQSETNASGFAELRDRFTAVVVETFERIRCYVALDVDGADIVRGGPVDASSTESLRPTSIPMRSMNAMRWLLSASPRGP
jgi:hypothetical protein